MDARRFLILPAVMAVSGCAAGPTTIPSPGALAQDVGEPAVASPAPGSDPPQATVLDGPVDIAPEALVAPAGPEPTTVAYAAPPVATGRRAIAAANLEARAASRADAFVGGVQLFSYAPGRVYEVWTAPLRVTALTLAAGEIITAKAAGDTLRWQIGEGTSGQGPDVRTTVLIKPLQTGLETNLVLTTTQRVYLLQLRSGAADAYNAAVAWDEDALRSVSPAPPPEPPLAPNLQVVEPAGRIDARYRIRASGRMPRWTPVAVFNDGTRTFIDLDPGVSVDEAPVLFVIADGEPQLTNYRHSGARLIVDRIFDVAELRGAGRRPAVVRIHRLGAGR